MKNGEGNGCKYLHILNILHIFHNQTPFVISFPETYRIIGLSLVLVFVFVLVFVVMFVSVSVFSKTLPARMRNPLERRGRAVRKLRENEEIERLTFYISSFSLHFLILFHCFHVFMFLICGFFLAVETLSWSELIHGKRIQTGCDQWGPRQFLLH